MEIYFIRHGQTDYNAHRRFQGQLDIPLNETGRKQARKLRDTLTTEQVKFSALYSSPLCRAIKTAEIIAGGALELRISEALIEIDLGEYDGRLESEIAIDIGADSYAMWRKQNYIVPAPGGESIIQAQQRVSGFLKEINSQFNIQDKIGVVGHQGIFTAMKAQLSRQSDRDSLDDYKQPNDQIDIWELPSNQRIRRIQISV